MDKKNLMEGQKLGFAKKQHDDKKDGERQLDSQDAQMMMQQTGS
jgi:hypothetical protein